MLHFLKIKTKFYNFYQNYLVALRPPNSNPLTSETYRLQDKSWAYVSEASAFAARLAAFSTALVDLLMRADELGVTEEDKGTIHALLLDLSALNFSQAARIKLHATSVGGIWPSNVSCLPTLTITQSTVFHVRVLKSSAASF